MTKVFNIINERTRLEVEDPVSKVLEKGTINSLTNRTILVRRDGTEVAIDDSGAPIRGEDGRLMGVVLVFRDITERRKAEQDMLGAEAKYKELSESINEIFFAMDTRLKCTYWNKASEAFTGIPAKNAIGQSLYELFHNVKGTKIEELFMEALKKQQPERLDIEYQIGRKKSVFEFNAYPTKTGLSIIAKDIGDRKKLEAQLIRAQRRESLGQLANGIAHDLNNILSPIMMSLALLREEAKDDVSQKVIDTIEKNAQRGADLVKQIQSFSKGVEGERKGLQVADVISEVGQIAKETFPKKIEFRTSAAKNLWGIFGDPTQLHQVLMNLLVNARDAMLDGGVLTISAENVYVDETFVRMHIDAKVGPYIVITVSDTGVGIAPEIMDRIFDPFFTTKEFGRGTGLGLSTALTIMKSHGGFMNVQCEVGTGSVFKVYLPAIEKGDAQKVAQEEIETPTGRGETILVVDDEASIREITRSTLEKYGYKVLTAKDGAEAAAVYTRHKRKVKIVLMDLLMPTVDGQASIQVIKKINPEVKIIAVSGLVEKERYANVKDHAQVLLPKPYTAEKLLETIHKVLNT